MARVVKVGGSLFAEPNLPVLLRQWLERQAPDLNLLVAGGGPLTDEIRTLDARFGVGECNSHWLCVSLLGVTARLLSALLPEAAYEDDFGRLSKLASMHGSAPRTVVLNVEPMLRQSEASLPGSTLPHSWDVTSDSIAARVAEVIDAHELVLLKSATPPATTNEMFERGYVDAHFSAHEPAFESSADGQLVRLAVKKFQVPSLRLQVAEFRTKTWNMD